MNKVIMMGRLTKAPKTRYNQSGTAISRFSLAVDRAYKRDGQPTADFFSCTAFGKTGEFVEKYLGKGTKILIDGRLQNNHYKDKNGVQHYSEEIIADRIEFAESKKSNDNNNTEAGLDGDFMGLPDDVDDSGIPFA